MGVLLQVTQSHGLTYHCPRCFSTKISYWSISLSLMNYLVRRPDLLCRPKQTWQRPDRAYLHSVSRPNMLYYSLFSGMLLVIVRVVVLQRLGRWVRALAVMVTLRQLKFVEHSAPATHSSSIPLRHRHRLALVIIIKLELVNYILCYECCILISYSQIQWPTYFMSSNITNRDIPVFVTIPIIFSCINKIIPYGTGKRVPEIP